MKMRSVLLTLASLLLIVVGVFVIRQKSTAAPAPPALHWGDPIPNPNGFDTCVQATKLLVDTEQIGTFYTTIAGLTSSWCIGFR